MLVVLHGCQRAASSSFGSCNSLPLLLPHDLFTFRNPSQSGIAFISDSIRVSDRKEANIAAWRVVSSPSKIAAAFFDLRSSPSQISLCSALDGTLQLFDIRDCASTHLLLTSRLQLLNNNDYEGGSCARRPMAAPDWRR